jgi:DNA-binding MarR family transcriptional regulator
MDATQARVINDAVRTIAMRHRALAAGLLAPLGLHPGQEVILFDLDEHGPRTQVQLATASGCEPPTITGSVRRLESAGLVARHPSPTDGRVTIVELSDRGRALMPALRQAWEQLAERTVTESGDTPPAQLAAVLTDLAAGLRRSGSRPA